MYRGKLLGCKRQDRIHDPNAILQESIGEKSPVDTLLDSKRDVGA